MSTFKEKLLDRTQGAADAVTKAATQIAVDKALEPAPVPRTPESTGIGQEDEMKKAALFGGTPQKPGRSPFGTSGEFGTSRGYSFCKAAGVARGLISPEYAKQELEVSKQLNRLYKGVFNARDVESGDTLLVPLSTSHIVTTDSEGADIPWAQEFMKGLNQSLHSSVYSFDPDEIDWNRRRTKALNTLNDNQGGSLVPGTPISDVIELQYKMEAFSQLGATQATFGPNGRLSYSKITGGSTAFWVGEGNPLTQSQQKTGALELVHKKLAVLVSMTSEMMRFATASSEQQIRNDMAVQAGLLFDLAMLEGPGASTSPKGITTYPSAASWQQNQDFLISYTASGAAANGDTFRPRDVYRMTTKLPDMVQKKGNLGYVFRPDFAEFIMTSQVDAATAGDKAGGFAFNWNRDPAAKVSMTLNGSSVALTSNVSNTRVKGTGNNLTYVLHGYFPDWIIARLGVAEFQTFSGTDTAMTNDLQYIRMIQHVDAGPRHASSFVFCDNLLIAP